jgi:hypothetical protein
MVLPLPKMKLPILIASLTMTTAAIVGVAGPTGNGAAQATSPGNPATNGAVVRPGANPPPGGATGVGDVPQVPNSQMGVVLSNDASHTALGGTMSNQAAIYRDSQKPLSATGRTNQNSVIATNGIRGSGLSD